MGALSWFIVSMWKWCGFDSLLKDFHKAPPIVQTHLKRVYLARSGVAIANALGACFHILWTFGGLPTIYGYYATKFWFLCTPRHKIRMKICLLITYGALYGASLPQLSHLKPPKDRIVFAAQFGLPDVAFICFGAALMFPIPNGRKHILAGLLSFGVSVLLLVHVPSCIFRCPRALSLRKLLDTYIFMNSVFFVETVFYTWSIINEAKLGNLDYDALDYWTGC